MPRSAPTRTVREELVRVRAARPCDRRAEVAGLLRSAGTFHVLPGARFGLEATTEHPGVARRFYEALSDLAAHGEVLLLEPGRGHPHKRYLVRALDVNVQRLVEAGLLNERGAPGGRVPRRIVAKRCCVAAYLRGAFLARGSISDPRRGAHLELRADDEDAALALAALVRQASGSAARVRRHRGGWAAYLKDTAAIGTLLAAIGAHGAYLTWEEAAVWKGVHVEVSRLANADAANARRLARASVEQIAAIEEVDEAIGLRTLPPALREAADLRRAHPDASLEELGRLCRPPVSKAAIAGRLRRLLALAEAPGVPATTADRRREDEAAPPGVG